MNKLSYDQQKEQLIAGIDIAIKAFNVYPPKNWNESTRQQALNTYLSWKNELGNPDTRFKNIQSLGHIKNDVLIYFQEASGETVEYFWQQIKDTRLEFKRENKLKKILKREKINSHLEYDFVVDVLVPYKQDGLITYKEFDLLNQLLAKYNESKSQ